MTGFEKRLHDMFGHIWECEIDHPIFQDTVGELMSAVIQCYNNLPSAQPEQPEIIRCKDCKWWRQQTNYQGTSLSFGFCESDDMWCSLYGETTEVAHVDTDDNHYCGYAKRRTDD